MRGNSNIYIKKNPTCSICWNKSYICTYVIPECFYGTSLFRTGWPKEHKAIISSKKWPGLTNVVYCNWNVVVSILAKELRRQFSLSLCRLYLRY